MFFQSNNDVLKIPFLYKLWLPLQLLFITCLSLITLFHKHIKNVIVYLTVTHGVSPKTPHNNIT